MHLGLLCNSFLFNFFKYSSNIWNANLNKLTYLLIDCAYNIFHKDVCWISAWIQDDITFVTQRKYSIQSVLILRHYTVDVGCKLAINVWEGIIGFESICRALLWNLFKLVMWKFIQMVQLQSKVQRCVEGYWLRSSWHCWLESFFQWETPKPSEVCLVDASINDLTKNSLSRFSAVLLLHVSKFINKFLAPWSWPTRSEDIADVESINPLFTGTLAFLW